MMVRVVGSEREGGDGGLYIRWEVWGYMGAGGYEDTDGYCIVSGERLHSEIPRLLLGKIWTICNEGDDQATARLKSL